MVVSEARIPMKLFAAILACVIFTPPVAAKPGFEFFQPLMPPRRFAVVAHRGLAHASPENTRRTVKLCIDDGVEWVAVDVRRTKDGRHVLFADELLDAKTNGTGAVGDYTLDELQQLDAGSWFAKRFRGERLLALDECLALAKGKINLCLDCKQVDAAAMVSAIRAAGLERQVLIWGDEATVRRVREVSQGTVAVMPKRVLSSGFDEHGHPTDAFGMWTDELQPAAVAFCADEITPEICDALHARGIKVFADALGKRDEPGSWDKALVAGADFLLSDVPEEVVAHVLDRGVNPRPVLFACHRGASRYAPENTLAAFEKAHRLHADFVEFDVRPSHDGEYFLLHDGRLDRTTTGKGPIRDAASATIAELDAGSWFGRPFAGTRVPTLDQFLSAVPDDVSLYFDAKDIPPETLAAALQKHGLVERTIVYQGAGYLANLKKIDSRIRAMPGVGSLREVDTLAATLAPYAVDTPWRILSKSYIEHCHAAGIRVFSDAPFLVDVEGYRQAIEWGIDLIQTDHPIRLWRAMELTAAERPTR